MSLTIEIMPAKRAITLTIKKRASIDQDRTVAIKLGSSIKSKSRERARLKYNKIKITAPTDHFPKRVSGLTLTILAGAEGIEPSTAVLETAIIPLN